MTIDPQEGYYEERLSEVVATIVEKARHQRPHPNGTIIVEVYPSALMTIDLRLQRMVIDQLAEVGIVATGVTHNEELGMVVFTK